MCRYEQYLLILQLRLNTFYVNLLEDFKEYLCQNLIGGN